VDVHTTGLGGDSHVRYDREGQLRIGPRRAVPLALLAHDHPEVVAELRRQVQLQRSKQDDAVGEFMVLGRRPRSALSEQEQELLARLNGGAKSFAQLVERSRAGSLMRRRVEDMEGRGLLRRAGFTPTDALHVLGRYCQWDVEAARLGATLLAARAGLPVEAFCELVVSRFSDRVATELVSKVLEDEVGRPEWEHETAGGALLRRALDGRGPDGAETSDLGCALTLRRPLVAIGAPVAAYLPQVAASLHTELVIPEFAQVANAVGAVSGSIIQRVHALINPLDEEGGVRLHLPDGVHDFTGVEAAVTYAQQTMPAHVEALAREAGAEHIEVRVSRHDHTAMTRGGFQEIYLGSELSFTAAGRPSPARA
jgi:N-methylhydantoinase A/oxoprolinase/acetone carboxylase beta subunit